MKHPVPKQKQSKARSAKRYGMFSHLVKTRLLNKTPLVPCKHCGEKTKAHVVCPNCGYLGTRQVIDMNKKIEKITKVKA